MEWLDRLNRAVDYIENHLEDEISYEEAAKLACCSTFHFQRMFSYIAGVPLSEYIRRRRMTAAAFNLQIGSDKVLDIALRYGYDSPTAFNRAFQSIHGVSPKSAKEMGVSLKTYPRISFHITIKGDAEMNYRIEKKEPFRIIGAKMLLEKEIEQNFQSVPLFWQKTTEKGLMAKLPQSDEWRAEGRIGSKRLYGGGLGVLYCCSQQ